MEENELGKAFGSLLGAKFAADFLRQAWESTPPEQRAAIAEQVAARVARTALEDYRVEQFVRDAAGRFIEAAVREYIATRRDELDAAVRKHVEARWDGAVRDAADLVLRRALDGVRASLQDALDKARGAVGR